MTSTKAVMLILKGWMVYSIFGIERLTMKKKNRILSTLLSTLMATLLFTFFRRIVMFTGLVNFMVNQGWSLLSIQITAAAIEFLFAGMVVFVIMPRLLGLVSLKKRLLEFLYTDFKIIVLGVLSYVVFGLLGAGIAKTLGIYIGDFSVILAWPDIKPDPDVVGFGYFILALVPGIWEELAFRGLVLSRLEREFKLGTSIFLSAFFFALFHLSNLITQPPSSAIGGVIMSFFFGLVWGMMKVRTGSVVPAMLLHYLIDAMGAVFLNVNGTDPAKVTLFFLLLVITFSIVNVLMTMVLFPTSKMKMGAREEQLKSERI